MPILIALAALASSPPSCTHELVRTAKSVRGDEAIEEIRVCDLGPYVTTGQNQIFLRIKRSPRPVLIARLESVGRKGVPLSWEGKTLIVHLPVHYHGSSLQVIHRHLAGVSLTFIRDYSDEEQLRD